jgi:hypothetical protein
MESQEGQKDEKEALDRISRDNRHREKATEEFWDQELEQPVLLVIEVMESHQSLVVTP